MKQVKVPTRSNTKAGPANQGPRPVNTPTRQTAQTQSLEPRQKNK